jgi:hypothetical protein
MEHLPSGGWSGEGKQADSQRDVEAERRKGRSKEVRKQERFTTETQRHGEERREERDLMVSDFLLLRFLLRASVSLW